MASIFQVKAGYEPQPMFDPRARLIYAALGVEMAIGAVLYRALGLYLSDWSLVLPSVPFAVMVVAALLARRVGFVRIALWLEATGLTYLLGLTGWALLLPATVVSGPFADPWLSALDEALGFNFPALDAAVKGWWPIYHSFTWQPLLIIPILVITRRDVWPLVFALLVAMTLTYLIFPFAPAMGPRVFYGTIQPDAQTVMIEALRDRGVREVTPGLMIGMVSFPSFHAAAAAIYTWAMWPVRFFRWPFLALNAALIFSTMPEGDHYLTDVLGGLLVAWVAIAVTSRLYRRHEEADRQTPAVAGAALS